MTKTPYGAATTGWLAGTARGVATGTGTEIRTNIDGASPYLLPREERDRLHGHRGTHH